MKTLSRPQKRTGGAQKNPRGSTRRQASAQFDPIGLDERMSGSATPRSKLTDRYWQIPSFGMLFENDCKVPAMVIRHCLTPLWIS
jgi:hypothetical protein